MDRDTAFQDLIPNNNCFGCGPHNERGLRLKSTWSGQEEAICRFQPAAHHAAGPDQFLNGGIISTLIDCHAVCTAIAYAYRREGRRIGQGAPIWYVTGGLNVSFKRPLPIDQEVTVTAEIEGTAGRKTTVQCTVSAAGKICAVGEVIAVRVDPDWAN